MANHRPYNFRGFTLLEALIYISIVLIISATALYFFNWSLNANTKIKTKQEVLDNGERVLRILGSEIRNSLSIYTPTSLLNNDSGQISIETTQDLPNQENITYHDIFLDPTNQTIFLKQEGQPAIPLTSTRVAAQKLNFQLIENSLVVDLTLQDKITSKNQLTSTINWQTTISLR